MRECRRCSLARGLARFPWLLCNMILTELSSNGLGYFALDSMPSLIATTRIAWMRRHTPAYPALSDACHRYVTNEHAPARVARPWQNLLADIG